MISPDTVTDTVTETNPEYPRHYNAVPGADIPDTGSREAALMTGAAVIAILCQSVVSVFVYRKQKRTRHI